ncbi:MAG: ABC-2 family transporter protein [Bryobacterales bacterium]|jgi:ABC-2 type transport system permease protein|nr:ABC-2 family transporter protein [Bryobacterales bacterium]
MTNPRALAEFAKIGFINMMAFRLRYYTGIVTYFINVTVYYFIWRAVFDADPTFASLRFEEMLTYVSLGWVIRSIYFNNIDVQLSQDILEGKITAALLKPVDLQASIVARAAGEALFRLLMLALPAALLLFAVYPLLPPAGPIALVLFVAAVTGSILLVAAINFIVGAFAVKMKSILGLLRAKFYLMDLLSGLIVPITLYPPPLRELSEWLPFQHIAYTPLMIYLGKSSGGQAWQALGITYLWVFLLLGAGWLFWRWMMRGITIHGG